MRRVGRYRAKHRLNSEYLRLRGCCRHKGSLSQYPDKFRVDTPVYHGVSCVRGTGLGCTRVSCHGETTAARTGGSYRAALWPIQADAVAEIGWI